jgi:hypothetical protein
MRLSSEIPLQYGIKKNLLLITPNTKRNWNKSRKKKLEARKESEIMKSSQAF